MKDIVVLKERGTLQYSEKIGTPIAPKCTDEDEAYTTELISKVSQQRRRRETRLI